MTRWCDAQPELGNFTGECRVRRAELKQLNGAWSDARNDLAGVSTPISTCGLPDVRRTCAEISTGPGTLRRCRGVLHRGRVASAMTRSPGLALLRLAAGQCASRRRDDPSLSVRVAGRREAGGDPVRRNRDPAGVRRHPSERRRQRVVLPTSRTSAGPRRDALRDDQAQAMSDSRKTVRTPRSPRPGRPLGGGSSCERRTGRLARPAVDRGRLPRAGRRRVRGPRDRGREVMLDELGADSPGSATPGRSAFTARDRGTAARCHRSNQPRDRGPAGVERADGRSAHEQHLHQARCLVSVRGDGLRASSAGSSDDGTHSPEMGTFADAVRQRRSLRRDNSGGGTP